jgi:hypothetical protein
VLLHSQESAGRAGSCERSTPVWGDSTIVMGGVARTFGYMFKGRGPQGARLDCAHHNILGASDFAAADAASPALSDPTDHPIGPVIKPNTHCLEGALTYPGSLSPYIRNTKHHFVTLTVTRCHELLQSPRTFQIPSTPSGCPLHASSVALQTSSTEPRSAAPAGSGTVTLYSVLAHARPVVLVTGLVRVAGTKVRPPSAETSTRMMSRPPPLQA